MLSLLHTVSTQKIILRRDNVSFKEPRNLIGREHILVYNYACQIDGKEALDYLEIN